ncbi:MAG: hypothetical protein ACYC33_07710 [Thermoleophilia bacterium]
MPTLEWPGPFDHLGVDVAVEEVGGMNVVPRRPIGGAEDEVKVNPFTTSGEPLFRLGRPMLLQRPSGQRWKSDAMAAPHGLRFLEGQAAGASLERLVDHRRTLLQVDILPPQPPSNSPRRGLVVTATRIG